MGKSPVSEWIERKYLEWQLANGRASATKFATFLGVSKGYVIQLMHGERVRISQATATRWAKLLKDYSILDILGYAQPTLLELDFESVLDKLPSGVRADFEAAYLEYNEELIRKGIENDSPEARRIVKDAFSRHGINLAVKEGD